MINYIYISVTYHFVSLSFIVANFFIFCLEERKKMKNYLINTDLNQYILVPQHKENNHNQEV